MSETILPFDRNHIYKKQLKDDSDISNINLGYICLDLLLSNDGTNLFVRPTSSLDDDIDDSLLDQFNVLLKKYFPDIIDQLFELYKSSN